MSQAVHHDEHDPDSGDRIDNLDMGFAIRVNSVLSAVAGEPISLEWLLFGTGNEPICVQQNKPDQSLPVTVPASALTDPALLH